MTAKEAKKYTNEQIKIGADLRREEEAKKQAATVRRVAARKKQAKETELPRALFSIKNAILAESFSVLIKFGSNMEIECGVVRDELIKLGYKITDKTYHYEETSGDYGSPSGWYAQILVSWD